jgi:GTPase
VYNNLDQAPADFVRDLEGAETTKYCVSAVTGEGLAALTAAIRSRVSAERVTGELQLGPDQSRARAQLFEWHAVRAESAEIEGGWTLAIDLTAERWRQLCAKERLPADSIRQKV